MDYVHTWHIEMKQTLLLKIILCAKNFVKLIIFKAGMNLLKHTNQYDLLLLFNHNQTINNRKEKNFRPFYIRIMMDLADYYY